MLIIFHSQLIIYSTYSITLLGHSWIIPLSIYINYARFCVPYCKVLPDCYKWLFTYLSPNYINKYLNTHTSKYFTSEVLKGFFLSFSSVSNVLNLSYRVLYIFFVVFFLFDGPVQSDLLSAICISNVFLCLRIIAVYYTFWNIKKKHVCICSN